MLDEYIFLNDDNEELGAGGYGNAEVAEKRAEYLARKYNCQIKCFQLITTVESPKEVQE